MEDVQINVWAAVVAGLLGFAIGGLWYSPFGFARAWMAAAGVSEEKAGQASMRKVFGLALLAQLVMAFNLAFFIGPKGVAFGTAAGLAVGLGWVAMSLGVIYLFEQRPFRLWLINAGYQIVLYAAMGALIGAWH